MFKTKFKSISAVFFLILFGSILRIYNLNFDDFWYDEMVTFWLSDPNLTFFETLKRVFSSNLMVTYEIFLKLYHQLVGYDVYNSRYFSSILSIISLKFFYVLLKKNSSTEAAIYGLLLLVINIHHIKYSFELRSYILTFLFTIILISLIFENKKIKPSFKILNYFSIFFVTLFLLFSHAFSAIIVFSLVIFLLLKLNEGKIQKKVITNLLVIFLFSLSIFLLIYLNNINHYPEWIEQVDLSFYTNFYFSKFFGSRLLGLLFLISFIYLLFKFRKTLQNNLDIYSFFLITIFASYILPLLFGYLIKPILVDRYILFVLIPLLALMSNFIFLLRNTFIKYFLIVFLIISQIANLFDEYTFKQFYTDIYPSKPEVKKSLDVIDKSNMNEYSFYLDRQNFINYNSVRENYIKKIIEKFDYKINFFNYYTNQTFPNKFWLIYFKDTTKENFRIPERLNEYTILSDKVFNRIELYLLVKNKDL